MSQRLSRMALPVFRVSSTASSSRSRSSRSATRSSSAARSPVGVRGQSVVSKARRAAAIACCTWSSVATSTSVTTVASLGLMTWLHVPSPEATHFPSMNRLDTDTLEAMRSFPDAPRMALAGSGVNGASRRALPGPSSRGVLLPSGSHERPAMRGRLPDGIPEPGHAQPHLGRTRVGGTSGPDIEELLPDGACLDGPHPIQPAGSMPLDLEALTPDPGAQGGPLAEHADLV